MERRTCRACWSRHLNPCFSLGEQVISSFFATRQEAVNGAKLPIDIVICQDCKLLQQKYTAPSELLWSGHYWYRSGTTATMRAALADIAQLVAKHLPDDGTHIDIGANDGTLSAVVEALKPNAHLVGVEPAENLVSELALNVDLVYKGFWNGDAALKCGRADVITAIGMLYDLEEPNDFIAAVSRALKPGGTFICQFMTAMDMALAHDIGNLCHEHLEFWTYRSLVSIFAKHDLHIADLSRNTVNGASTRFVVRKDVKYESSALEWALDAEDKMHLGTTEHWERWYDKCNANRVKVRNAVQSYADMGRTIMAYGASTKGNVLLQWLDVPQIECAADKAAEKHGRYMAGTGVHIVPEESAREYADVLLVLPYAFIDEFRAREQKFLQRGGRMLVPLPQFKEYSA